MENRKADAVPMQRRCSNRAPARHALADRDGPAPAGTAHIVGGDPDLIHETIAMLRRTPSSRCWRAWAFGISITA
jgi:hypothetical protein